uniref:Terpene cyclase/mutase family member n=1 Tax=Lygodium japonicum TaxID=13824 RepID=A0A679ETU2_LYGJA|nr:hopene synthase [Lygodium japonicum]
MQQLPYSQDISGGLRNHEFEAEEDSNRRPLHSANIPMTSSRLEETIKQSQEFLLSLQYPEGYWWGELESNVTITAETVLLYKILGIEDDEYPRDKMERYLRKRQRDHGGWELFYGDGGELSVTTEAYIALRLLGVRKADLALKRALRFILERGGVTKTRIFTKLCLAMLGCFGWRGIPSLPVWFMLLPSWFLTSIYEMSSWARGCTVPLMVVFDKKPVFSEVVTPQFFDELYAEGRKRAPTYAKFEGKWTDVFLVVDRALKVAEKLNLVPFRKWGLREAERWVLERQEDTGDWGGIFPAMFYSILCMKTLGYELTDPVIQRGLKALRDFAMETEEEYWVQPCVSPVWDTALVVRALVESGMAPDHPSLQRAGEWLLQKQITQPGDWAFKNRAKQGSGGWAFEFVNRWYPDVDDSAVVVMALQAVRLPPHREPVKEGAISRAVEWIASMQCKAGGWGAFDKNNNQDWLNATPYGDLKAMIDPNTSDVTARVLEMVGRMKPREQYCTCLPLLDSINRGMAYLRKEQEPDGCWFGRWGVNYIYGTCGAMVALSLVDPSSHQEELSKGAKWLVQVQNATDNTTTVGDGGWGESCYSYNDPALKGNGAIPASTPSQTAWALMGLMAAGDTLGKYYVDAIEDGISYLMRAQRKDGSWHEAHFTGTGFPGHFYIRYHLYAQHFALTALARYHTRLHGKQIMRARYADLSDTEPNN